MGFLDWVGPISSGVQSLGNTLTAIGNRKSQENMNNANIAATERINAENRQFSKDMWNMTNEYNSPAQQMARYKAAGLNPHLIYGSQPQASQPMSASTSVPHVEKLPVVNPVGDISRGVFDATMSYLATKKQQTEIDNMEKTSQVMDADILSKNAATAESMGRTARNKFDLELAQILKQNTIDAAILNTKNLGLTSNKIEVDIAASKAGAKLTYAQIQKVAQDILTAKKQIELMEIQGQNAKADLLTKQLDQQLKQYDLNLRADGVNSNDPAWMRMPIQFFNQKDWKEKASKVWDTFKGWFSK